MLLNQDTNGILIQIIINKENIDVPADCAFSVEDVKPYLRPMSSMTEEEKKEYHKLCDNYYDIYFNSIGSIDWLNAHHFDYRGLIEKGLAIEAPEGMYDN